MFEPKDVIGKINKNAETIYTLSPEESCEINDRINEEMRKVDLDFRIKQAKTIESAKRTYITF